MRTRIFSGVEYIKATEIARMHHYAPDYIGQLCRTGKIEARLAGRTWYATEASFKAYQSGRYGGQTATPGTLSTGRETTPTNKREAIGASVGTTPEPAPKIAVAKPKPAKSKQPAPAKAPAKKKPVVAKAAPKKVTEKKAAKPTKEKKITIVAKVAPAPLPNPAPAQEAPKGIKGLFKRLFGR